ncbi:hypothetical protein QTP88_023403 [Uroleucon formosanum]
MSDGELDEGYSVSQSSSTSSSLTTLPTPSLPRSIDGKFFKFLNDKSCSRQNKRVVQCVKCEPKVVQLKGYANSTSNFVTHLKRRHGPDAVEEYKNYLKSTETLNKKIKIVAKQLKTKITQENFETEMINFFLHSMIPLRCVEDPYFLKMFDALNISDCGLRVLSRRSFCRKIDNFYEKNKNEIKEELNDAQFVCTTVDIWSGKKRSFLGAFKMFRVKLQNIDIVEDLHLVDNDNSESDLESNENYMFENVVGHTIEIENILPVNFRCFAHTLNLCATTDINKVIKSSVELSLIHDQVIKKCNILWKLAGRPKSAEVIQNVLGHTLSRPGETRWNSLYDSLRQILSIKNNILNLNRTLEINNKNCLREQDFNYIEEHLKCTAPISEALDIMQGEVNTYYGVVLPCLLALKRKIEILANPNHNTWTYCKSIVNALLESIEKRFGNYLNFTSPESLNAAIAALSYPRFKKRWLTCVETEFHDRLIRIFQKTADEIFIEKSTHLELEKSPKNQTTDDFFDFGSSTLTLTGIPKSELEVLHYFADEENDLQHLNKYPTIKQVFIRYNTPLPSSAPVERLFSFATMTNQPKSHKLSDHLFEKRVVLKANLL